MSDGPAKYDVGIVGLGYVGLTLATVLAEAGVSVVGVERRAEIVEQTNAGTPHFTETGLPDALEGVTRSGKLVAVEQFEDSFTCDAYIITVGTPLSPEGVARTDMIESAARDIAANMNEGALVILRSTVKVGTTRDVVAPVLAASGKSFDIAMCPERTLEGKALQELRELPQIIGADDQQVADRAAAIFRKLTSSIVSVSDIETAEIIKLVSNTFRDVQFAFANEVARICDAFGASAYEVISAGKLGYNRTNIPLPGLVGGPCLEKDPHILMESARTRGIDLEITRAGRMVNERQPKETVRFIRHEVARRELPTPLRISMVGVAFKGQPETSDLRGSMAIRVLDELKKAFPDAEIGIYDPVTPVDVLSAEFPDTTVYNRFGDAVSGASVIVVGNNHPSLGRLSPRTLTEFMLPDGFVFDYWNHFSHLPASELGDSYFAVGKSGLVLTDG
jgi:UDP-N-acetyl-D-mannosaminuronic acid dehydrogenase